MGRGENTSQIQYCSAYFCFSTTVTVCDQTTFTGPAPPPAPAMLDNSPLRAIEEGGKEGRRKGGNEARKASTDVTNDYNPDSDGKIGGECHAGCYDTDVWTCEEESPSPPVSDDASATGRTYYDVTKLPPPHLRYVVSPLPAVPPVLRCTAAPLPQPYFFLPPTSRGRGGFRPCSSRGCQPVVWCLT